MAKKTWDVLILILGIAIEVIIFVKDKITGGKNDNRSGSSAEA